MTRDSYDAAEPLPLQKVRVEVELEIPSDVRYIERVVELVRSQCEHLDYAPRQVALNVPVALTEALSNAILRGNCERGDASVRIRADVDRERLVLEVADEGPGFDIAACTLEPTPEALEREDGRGLYLMQQLMDTVERFERNGNVVRLVLRRG